MYTGGSVVGKNFNNRSRDLAHPSPDYHRRLKSAKFGVVSNITQIWAARVWKFSSPKKVDDPFSGRPQNTLELPK